MAHAITFRARRTKTARPHVDFETMSTGQLLRLHERHFGPLHPRSKERMMQVAVSRGWDRSWHLDGLAA